MKTSALPRATCPTAKKPLFAWVDRNNKVIGVCNGGDQGVEENKPDPQGRRYLPLFGEEPSFEPMLQMREGPTYVVTDRVARFYKVRPKLASELLHEIGSWAASQQVAEPKGMSPFAVEESARETVAALGAMYHGGET